MGPSGWADATRGWPLAALSGPSQGAVDPGEAGVASSVARPGAGPGLGLPAVTFPAPGPAEALAVVAPLTFGVVAGAVFGRHRREARERSERAALRRHFETLANLVDDIIVLVDGEGRVVQANDRALGAYGYSQDELRGLFIGDLRAPAERPALEADLTRIRAERRCLYQTVHRRRDGTTFPVEISARRLDIGGATYIQGIVRDIGERQRFEHELRDSAAKYRALFEGANDGVLLMRGLKFVDCNARAAELFGCPRERVLTSTPVDFSPVAQPDGRSSAEKAAEVVDAARRGELRRFEWEHRRCDGAAFFAEVTLSAVEIGGERLVQAIMRDVTDRIRAEQQLKEANEQLRLLVEGTPHFFFYLQDLDGSTTYVSPSVTAITGRSPAEWLGQSHWFATANPINDLARAQTRSHLRGDFAVATVLTEVEHADGRAVLLEAIETGLYRDGRLVGIQGIAHDVTEQVRSRARIDLLAHALRSVGEGVCVTDSHDVIEFVNEAFCRLFGYGEAELVGRNIAMVRSPHTDPTVAARIVPGTLAGGWRGELWNRRKDGTDILVSLSTSVVKDEAGRPLALIGVVRDITDQQRAELALKEALAWQERIFEGSRDAVLICDDEARITAVNRAATQLTGYSHDELLTMRIADLYAHLNSNWYAGFHDRVLAGEAFVTEAPVRRKSGEVVHVEVSNSGIEVAGRRFVHIAARDISERRRAERALRDSEERYRRFFEEDLTGDFIAGPDGRLIDCNPAFARMLGFESVAAAKAASFWEIFPSPEAHERALSLLLDRGSLAYHELELRNRAGETVHTIANISGGFDVSGELLEMRGYLFDITRHKEVEDQLRHSQKMEALGRVAGGVAHDFNNLLQAMLSTLQLLALQPGDPAATASAARELEGMVRRGASLSRQLLLFARRSVSKPVPLDLNQLVHDASRFIGRLVPDNVQLVIEAAPGELMVEADHGQLEQVLTNLVVNAVDAMPAGGTVTLRTGRHGAGEAWMEVADIGSGIPAAALDRIFDPFFTTKAPGKGTGLGLAVVHGIVAQHGGRVSVASEVGRGSTFRVVLPDRGSGVAAATPEASAVASAGGGERVLVVEDDAEVRRALVRLLERLGYVAVEAASAEQALVLSDVDRCTLLLSDVSLPGASGCQLARRLLARWPELKVILMSGYAADEVLRHDISQGRFRFLQKPVGLDALARELQAALDEP